MQLVNDVIQALPPFKGERDLITHDQSTADIINEVLECHNKFAPDYDTIVDLFVTVDPLLSVFNFCRDNMPYNAETEKDQTSRSPIAILMLADTWGVDCKHYAGFIAGVIDALNRAGYSNYDWVYRFASYDLLDPSKEHVFVVVKNKKDEIWLDPAPIENSGSFIERSFNDRKVIPFYITDRKPQNMSLTRISGCCINPNYQAAAMGLTILQNFDRTDINWDTPIEDLISQKFNPVDPIDVDVFELPPPEPTYDPSTITFDPLILNRLESSNDPLAWDSDGQLLNVTNPATNPVTTAATTTTATNTNSIIPEITSSTDNFSIKEFIQANPVETILIGSAAVLGIIVLIKRSKRKKR